MVLFFPYLIGQNSLRRRTEFCPLRVEKGNTASFYSLIKERAATFTPLAPALIIFCFLLGNSYTMGCPPVRGDNPRALARGLSYIQVDKHGITI